ISGARRCPARPAPPSSPDAAPAALPLSAPAPALDPHARAPGHGPVPREPPAAAPHHRARPPRVSSPRVHHSLLSAASPDLPAWWELSRRVATTVDRVRNAITTALSRRRA